MRATTGGKGRSSHQTPHTQLMRYMRRHAHGRPPEKAAQHHGGSGFGSIFHALNVARKDVQKGLDVVGFGGAAHPIRRIHHPGGRMEFPLGGRDAGYRAVVEGLQREQLKAMQEREARHLLEQGVSREHYRSPADEYMASPEYQAYKQSPQYRRDNLKEFAQVAGSGALLVGGGLYLESPHEGNRLAGRVLRAAHLKGSSAKRDAAPPAQPPRQVHREAESARQVYRAPANPFPRMPDRRNPDAVRYSRNRLAALRRQGVRAEDFGITGDPTAQWRALSALVYGHSGFGLRSRPISQALSAGNRRTRS